MDLFFKRPSKKAREAMCNAALKMRHQKGGRYGEIAAAKESVSGITGHEYVKTVNSGNSAILGVMSSFKGKILIPDQGGWTGFKMMADFLGLERVEVKTDRGIIETDLLRDTIEKKSPEAFFLTSFAGYTAEQPVKDIHQICEDSGVIMVEDASGSVGDSTGRLANGDHAHVMVASTGSPKVVNVGNGGFISTDDKKILDNSRIILKTLKADPITCAGISEEIKIAPPVLSQTIAACQFLKSGLKGYETVLHPEKRGTNICISLDNPKKAGYKLRKSFNVHGGGMITVCPRYDRILADAVCIEIKNLDLRCLNQSNLEEMLLIINETLKST